MVNYMQYIWQPIAGTGNSLVEIYWEETGKGETHRPDSVARWVQVMNTGCEAGNTTVMSLSPADEAWNPLHPSVTLRLLASYLKLTWMPGVPFKGIMIVYASQRCCVNNKQRYWWESKHKGKPRSAGFTRGGTLHTTLTQWAERRGCDDSCAKTVFILQRKCFNPFAHCCFNLKKICSWFCNNEKFLLKLILKWWETNVLRQ